MSEDLDTDVQGTAEEDILLRTGCRAALPAAGAGVAVRATSTAGTHKVAESDRRTCNSLLAALHRVTAAAAPT